jgi:hypothetical protein
LGQEIAATTVVPLSALLQSARRIIDRDAFVVAVDAIFGL